jgi:DNA-binding PucR family transcriptional regulator
MTTLAAAIASSLITAAIIFATIYLVQKRADSALNRMILAVSDRDHTIAALHTRLIAPLEAANADIAQEFERVAAETRQAPTLVREVASSSHPGESFATVTTNLPRTTDDLPPEPIL